jgi:hypothetical protein
MERLLNQKTTAILVKRLIIHYDHDNTNIAMLLTLLIGEQ